MVKTKRQHQQWTCAATIKTNLSQPTRRLHAACSFYLYLYLFLAYVCMCVCTYVSGGFLVGLTRTDVGKKRQQQQQQQQKQRIHNQFQKSDSVRSWIVVGYVVMWVSMLTVCLYVCLWVCVRVCVCLSYVHTCGAHYWTLLSSIQISLDTANSRGKTKI